MSPPKLSIIIVDYKTTTLVQQQKKALIKSAEYELIVIDNNVINRGYGAGLNEGVRKSNGEFLLFLNPDVTITPHHIQTLVTYLTDHEDVAVVGPQIIDTHGNIVPSSLGPLSARGAFVGLSFLNKIFKHNTDSQAFWLPDWNRKTTREVFTVNGACVCIRREDFERVGGFDESFFLYWEENDLCDRIRYAGRKIVFLAQAQATHVREASMKQSNLDLSHVFQRSRSMYIRKHFGAAKGFCINTFLWLNDEWRTILLWCIALLPRIVNPNSLVIIDDVRRDYSEATKIIFHQSFPLLGIPSSVPRFSQGPFNVWFDALAFMIGGINMHAPVVAAAILVAVGVVLFYKMLTKVVSKNIAFISALLWALSMGAITQSRMPFYLFAIPVFLVFYLNSLLNLHKKSGISVFMAILTFWWLFQWELATIPLIVLLPVAIFRNRIQVKTIIVPTILATTLGLLPQILFDITHACRQLCGFVVWMGYRTVAVSGFDGRHGFVLFQVQFWKQVIIQISRLIGFNSPILTLGVLGLAGIGIVSLGKQWKENTLFSYTLISTICLLVGLVVHGDPSEAYFPPFLVLIPVLVAFGISKFLKREKP